MNYDYLNELIDSEEMRDEIVQRVINLQILLDVKKRLGDLVDITDRLFGYNYYCDEGNDIFFFSTISVIFSLPDKMEKGIREEIWTLQDWVDEGYPTMDYEEIRSLHIPFACPCEQMEAAIAQLPSSTIGEIVRICVKNNQLVLYLEADYYYELFETALEICISLRQILEGGVADAKSPN
jgi:hypothetical protein